MADQLRRAFLTYNRKFFKNEIPRDLPVEWKKLRPTLFGVCYFEGSKPTHIAINSKLEPIRVLWRWTLLHELAHAHLPVGIQHGPKFNAEMLRIAKLGAFKGLW